MDERLDERLCVVLIELSILNIFCLSQAKS